MKGQGNIPISVMFVERTIDLPNFSGFMKVIETSCECLDDGNGQRRHYIIHWRIDEKDNVRRYAHEVRVGDGPPDSLASIPYEIYERMHGEALSFFEIEKDKDSVKSLHEYIIEVDPQDKSKASIRFKRLGWSAYRFSFRLQANGGIQAIQTINNSVLAGARAESGHKRAPKKAAKTAYAIISEYFAGCLNSDNHTQCELELSSSGASE